jgi:hypothetical protein
MLVHQSNNRSSGEEKTKEKNGKMSILKINYLERQLADDGHLIINRPLKK